MHFLFVATTIAQFFLVAKIGALFVSLLRNLRSCCRCCGNRLTTIIIIAVIIPIISVRICFPFLWWFDFFRRRFTTAQYVRRARIAEVTFFTALVAFSFVRVLSSETRKMLSGNGRTANVQFYTFSEIQHHDRCPWLCWLSMYGQTSMWKLFLTYAEKIWNRNGTYLNVVNGRHKCTGSVML